MSQSPPNWPAPPAWPSNRWPGESTRPGVRPRRLAGMDRRLFGQLDLYAGHASRRVRHAADHEPATWSLWQALSVLVAATAAPALAAELVSRALESTAAQLGLTTFFSGRDRESRQSASQGRSDAADWDRERFV